MGREQSEDTVMMSEVLITKVLLDATASGALTTGRLMSPADITAALAQRPADKERIAGWVMCGEIEPTVWELLRANPTAMRVSSRCVTGASGTSFLLVRLHIADREHSLVMPLVGRLVAEFVATTCQSHTLQMSLARGNGEESCVMSRGIPEGLAQQLQDLCRKDIVDAAVLYAESCALVALVTAGIERSDQSRLTNPDWVPVTHIFPEDVIEGIELAAAEDTGTRH
jgi:hypothetical protein